jgi:hypothetical protein
MKVIVVFKSLLASGNDQHGRHLLIQMGVTAGIFLASILLNEMRYLVYIRYIWSNQSKHQHIVRDQISSNVRGDNLSIFASPITTILTPQSLQEK